MDQGGPKRSACSGEQTDMACQSVGRVPGLQGRRHRSRVAVRREGKVRLRYMLCKMSGSVSSLPCRSSGWKGLDPSQRSVELLAPDR